MACAYPDCHISVEHTHRTVECAACARTQSGVCAWHIQQYPTGQLVPPLRKMPVPPHMLRPMGELASTAPEFRPDMVAVPRELLQGATEIVEKCEQYWNEHDIGVAEMHSILEFIHTRARKLREVLGDD